jgi:adenylylsulfate kinase
MIIWLTGQPGSGKTTLCKRMMLNMGSDVFHIDGDDLRDLFDNKDYSEIGRRKNIEYKDQRDKFKSKMGNNLIEVYVHTTEIRGKESFFVQDYEPPTENYIDIDTTNVSINDSANIILEFIKPN